MFGFLQENLHKNYNTQVINFNWNTLSIVLIEGLGIRIRHP